MRFKDHRRLCTTWLIAFPWLGLCVNTTAQGTAVASQKATTRITIQVLPRHLCPGPRAVRSVAGEFYVLSGSDHTVLMYDGNWELKRRIGRIGNGPGELLRPSSVDVAPDGTLWVADEGNNRVSRFSKDGSHLSSFASVRPQHVRYFSDGTVAVVEAFAEPLVKFYTVSGELVGTLTGLIPVAGASPKQTPYLNRSAILELQEGIAALAFRYLVPARVRTVRRDGSIVDEIVLPEGPIKALLTEAADRQKVIVEGERYGGRHVLNDIELSPSQEELGIVPGPPGLFK